MASNQQPNPELVQTDDHLAAIEQLLPSTSRSGDARKFMAFAHRNRVSLDWFWTIKGDDGLPGTCVLTIPSEGRTAMCFTSEVHDEASRRQLTCLVEHAMAFLEDQAIDLAQGLLIPEDNLGREAFLEARFQELATLQYMECETASHQNKPLIPDQLKLVTYEEAHRSDLATALEGSYLNTLDCPGLRGLRDIDDVINGHQSTGHFDPSLWTLAIHDDQPVGCVLINESTTGRQAELVYLGLSPQVRGKGYGNVLTRHAMWLAARERLHFLSLAVDLKNTPALTLYESLGFSVTNHRLAVIRSTRSLQD
jgi:ribosomal protein S18 acetylase RimI-like enzyme